MYKELENKIERFIKSTVEAATTVETVRLLSVGEIYDTIIEKLNNKNQFPKADRDLVMSKISGAVTDQIMAVAAGLKQEDPTPVVTNNVINGGLDIESIGEDHSFTPVEAGKEIDLTVSVDTPGVNKTIKNSIKKSAMELAEEHYKKINAKYGYDELFPWQKSMLRLINNI